MKKIMSLFVFLISCSLCYGWTVVPGGVQVAVEYDEPNTNSDGTPLTDLARTSVFYNTGAGDVKAFDQLATSLNGNGHISRNFTVPFPSGKKMNVSFYAVAIDTNSNVSEKSNVDTIGIDTLSPNTPRSITISGNMLFYNYREPITNSDGSLINDLASISVLYNDSISALLKPLGDFPASNPNGGGAQTVSFPLSIFNSGTRVTIFARAIDTHGNRSTLFPSVSINIP